MLRQFKQESNEKLKQLKCREDKKRNDYKNKKKGRVGYGLLTRV